MNLNLKMLVIIY